MKKYQTGISLVAVAVIMGALGAVAAFALISMRQERNLFAEGLSKVGANQPYLGRGPVTLRPNPDIGFTKTSFGRQWTVTAWAATFATVILARRKGAGTCGPTFKTRKLNPPIRRRCLSGRR